MCPAKQQAIFEGENGNICYKRMLCICISRLALIRHHLAASDLSRAAANSVAINGSLNGGEKNGSGPNSSQQQPASSTTGGGAENALDYRCYPQPKTEPDVSVKVITSFPVNVFLQQPQALSRNTPHVFVSFFSSFSSFSFSTICKVATERSLRNFLSLFAYVCVHARRSLVCSVLVC